MLRPSRHGQVLVPVPCPGWAARCSNPGICTNSQSSLQHARVAAERAGSKKRPVGPLDQDATPAYRTVTRPSKEAKSVQYCRLLGCALCMPAGLLQSACACECRSRYSAAHVTSRCDTHQSP